MPARFRPGVITANALLEGDVIYLGPQGWVRDLAAAELFEDEAIAQDALLSAAAQTDVAVGVYLAPMDPSGPTPLHFREAFRATGPSNYPHGKQESV